MRITLENGSLVENLEKLIRKPGQNPNPLCIKCPDEKKYQPIQGLTIVWHRKRDGDEKAGGYFLDSDNGTSYKCYVKVVANNEKLEIRGYPGFSLFGRTQTWLRTE